MFGLVTDRDVVEEFATGDTVLRAGILATLSDEPDAFIVARRLLRSSKGAPEAG